MDGSSYLSVGFLDIEEILDLQLVNHTSNEFKAAGYSGLRYNSQVAVVIISNFSRKKTVGLARATERNEKFR